MATRTQDDYADMVNPYVRAEQEAESRGYRVGLLSGIFYSFVAVIALGMLLVAIGAHASSVWLGVETWKPISASQVGARVTVCQPNPKPLGLPWLCYATR